MSEDISPKPEQGGSEEQAQAQQNSSQPPDAVAKPAPPKPKPQFKVVQSKSGSKLKKHLMIWIFATIVLLLALIGIRIYMKFHRGINGVDVNAEMKDAFEKSKSAEDEIFAIESKVWGRGALLAEPDFAAIRARKKDLEDGADKIQKMMELVHSDALEKEQQVSSDYGPKSLQLKVWVLDADDLLENEKKPPLYGGIYIQMNASVDTARLARKEIDECDKLKNEVLARNNARELKEASGRMGVLAITLKDCVDTFEKLSGFIKEGLTRPELTPADLPELKTLFDETNAAKSLMKKAQELSELFTR